MPRLRRKKLDGRGFVWVCSGDFPPYHNALISAWGRTPVDAYCVWLRGAFQNVVFHLENVRSKHA